MAPKKKMFGLKPTKLDEYDLPTKKAKMLKAKTTKVKPIKARKPPKKKKGA